MVRAYNGMLISSEKELQNSTRDNREEDKNISSSAQCQTQSTVQRVEQLLPEAGKRPGKLQRK